MDFTRLATGSSKQGRTPLQLDVADGLGLLA